MLLLRMCFKCPSSIREPFRGVWLFDKSQTFNEDVNYPVGQVFGRIYLKDSIAGYSGQPYDPVKEYHWMLSNCQWRNL